MGWRFEQLFASKISKVQEIMVEIDIEKMKEEEKKVKFEENCSGLWAIILFWKYKY